MYFSNDALDLELEINQHIEQELILRRKKTHHEFSKKKCYNFQDQLKIFIKVSI